MVGRASRGNPWIFREIGAAWLGEPVPPAPSAEEKLCVMAAHTEAEIAEKGEAVGCRELRKHLAWYTAGMSGGAALRKMAACVSAEKDVRAFLDAFAQSAHQP